MTARTPGTDALQVLPTEAYFAKVRQELDRTGQAYVRVTGISMQPLLHHLRDGVIIVPPKRLRTGDIVLFDRRNGRYALHRIVGRQRDGFTMAGDHQWHMEKHLPYDQIIGVAAVLHRNGRFIPCDQKNVRIYAWAVTLFTRPRIFLRRVITFPFRLLRRGKAPIKEHHDQNQVRLFPAQSAGRLSGDGRGQGGISSPLHSEHE